MSPVALIDTADTKLVIPPTLLMSGQNRRVRDRSAIGDGDRLGREARRVLTSGRVVERDNDNGHAVESAARSSHEAFASYRRS